MAKYTEELAKEICEQIATRPIGLNIICAENPDFPTARSVRRWIKNNEHFREMYREAKEDLAHALIEEIIAIADDRSNDTLVKTNKNGDEYEVCNKEWIARSKVRIDTRKWLAAKLLPRIYGQKLQVESVNDSEDPAILKARQLVSALMDDDGRNNSTES